MGTGSLPSKFPITSRVVSPLKALSGFIVMR